jgi:hypothetical protein
MFLTSEHGDSQRPSPYQIEVTAPAYSRAVIYPAEGEPVAKGLPTPGDMNLDLDFEEIVRAAIKEAALHSGR